jgi:hypothetical protein
MPGKTRLILTSLFGLIGVMSRPATAQQPNPAQLTAVVKTPTRVRLDWAPSAGAKGYWIQRATGTGNGGFSSINPATITATWYADAGALAATTLRYRVKAVYQTGSPTFSHVVTVITPALPSGATGVPSNPVSGSPAPMELLPAPVTQMAAAPAASPVAPTAPAAPPASRASGLYRVVATGFSVIHETNDDVLSRDGKYDEVYGGFLDLHFNRETGALMEHTLRQTKVLGDIAGFGDRLRAGSGNGPNGSGGLRSGDSYPEDGHVRFRGPVAPSDVTFPFLVWQGTLTNDADAVVILPTMWERDNDASSFNGWQQFETNSATQIWWDPAVQRALQQTGVGVIAPMGAATPWMGETVSGDVATQGNMAIATGLAVAWTIAAAQPWVAALFVGSNDRAIGIGTRNGPGFPRRAIVLTREVVEHALQSPKVFANAGMLGPDYPSWLWPYLDVPVGVIPVLLIDQMPGPPGNQNLPGAAYVLYLQLERL